MTDRPLRHRLDRIEGALARNQVEIAQFKSAVIGLSDQIRRLHDEMISLHSRLDWLVHRLGTQVRNLDNRLDGQGRRW